MVLDASVLLAILNREPGAERFLQQYDVFGESVVSSVNVAEACCKLVAMGAIPEKAFEAVALAAGEIVDFDAEQARTCGELTLKTRALGLSMGDRACLALGIKLEAPVYTTDRAWKNLKIQVPIRMIR